MAEVEYNPAHLAVIRACLTSSSSRSAWSPGRPVPSPRWLRGLPLRRHGA